MTSGDTTTVSQICHKPVSKTEPVNRRSGRFSIGAEFVVEVFPDVPVLPSRVEAFERSGTGGPFQITDSTLRKLGAGFDPQTNSFRKNLAGLLCAL